MGIKRWIWRSTPVGRTIDTTRNIIKEGSIPKGIKKTIKQDICKDNPITAYIYRAGKKDGKKEGYVDASKEYEQKLLSQADQFINQQQVYKEEVEAFNQLLTEYEAEIEQLTAKLNRTQEENDYLQALLLRERQLRKLA